MPARARDSASARSPSTIASIPPAPPPSRWPARAAHSPRPIPARQRRLSPREERVRQLRRTVLGERYRVRRHRLDARLHPTAAGERDRQRRVRVRVPGVLLLAHRGDASNERPGLLPRLRSAVHREPFDQIGARGEGYGSSGPFSCSPAATSARSSAAPPSTSPRPMCSTASTNLECSSAPAATIGRARSSHGFASSYFLASRASRQRRACTDPFADVRDREDRRSAGGAPSAS